MDVIPFSVIQQRIDEHINAVELSIAPIGLFAPIKYALSVGGKRLRPSLMLMANNLYTDHIDAAIDPAIGMEIFHNFTLLHDDLMDQADMRRNCPTVHKKWNSNTAILSGDAMLITAYHFIGKTTSEYLGDVLELFNQTALDICKGQQYDMEFETRTDVSEAEYLEMIRLKTAVLIAACLKAGAVMGAAPVADTEKLYQFGIDIGLMFQLQDDLLDTYGNVETFGKKIGGDILCNKKTFLLIHAMQRASDQQLKRIAYYQEKHNHYSPEEKIEAITSLYNELGIEQLTREAIHLYYTKAMRSLESLSVPKHRLSELDKLVHSMMERKV